MSDKKINAIKEIEFRVNRSKTHCVYDEKTRAIELCEKLDLISNLLFDINDFINDLKDE